jgi:SAM-dependent methyltransferase
MLSDGRVISRALVKASCRVCGCVSHATMPSPEVIGRWFTQGYTLSTSSPEADEARAVAYCNWVMAVVGDLNVGAVLEIGSGSGALLRAFSVKLPAASTLEGCEPSHQPSSSKRITFYRGTIDAVPPNSRYDLILAINVLEHVGKPAELLAMALNRLTPNGRIVVVCPNADVPNVELLFLDHLFSYTATGLRMLAQSAGLVTVCEETAPPRMGQFRMYVLRSEEAGARVIPSITYTELIKTRSAYAHKWATLDLTLGDRLRGDKIVAFGAGEMAALLRAFTPKTWEAVSSLEVDAPADAWQLGKPVVKYRGKGVSGAYLLAVSPASQDGVASRILADGGRPIGFNDIIGL